MSTTARRPRGATALAALLLLAGAAWLAVVQAAGATPADAQPVLDAWLGIALLGAGPAMVLAHAVDRAQGASGPLGAAALTAAAAAIAATLGAAALTVLDGGGSLVPGLVRDLCVALAATLPVATAVALLAGRQMAAPGPARIASPQVADGPGARLIAPTTRRGFLQIGAGSATTAAVGAMAARGVLPATAEANTLTFQLTITDGWRPLVDRTQGFFRGFKVTGASGGPDFPGPCIGNPGPGVSANEIFEGDTVRLVLTNDTVRDHTFLVERTASEGARDPVVGAGGRAGRPRRRRL